MTATSLTSRYVWAVVRLLPEEQRPDIDRELRSLIGDMVDDRVAAGEPLEAAERAVLDELGDPIPMAARYTEHPRALIGAELFPAYVRTLRLVATVVVPLVAVLSVVGHVVDADDVTIGGVVGAVLSGLFQAGTQVVFWVTAVYAAMERWGPTEAWTPDRLPEVPAAASDDGPGAGELALGIVFTILAGVALVWQHLWPALKDADGDGVPFLDPALWNGAGQALLATIAASVAIQGLVIVRRGWTMPLAIANGLVNAASVAIAAWASFGGWFLNDRFLEVLAERAEWSTVPTVSPWVPVLVVAAVDGWDTIEAFAHARRGRRAARDVDVVSLA